MSLDHRTGEHIPDHPEHKGVQPFLQGVGLLNIKLSVGRTDCTDTLPRNGIRVCLQRHVAELFINACRFEKIPCWFAGRNT